MAWERRHNRQYYYRASRAADGRVQKTYIGSGEAAAAVAKTDVAAREVRLGDLSAAKALAMKYEPLDRLLDELDRRVSLLTEAVLLSKGFHQHKDAWSAAVSSKSPNQPQCNDTAPGIQPPSGDAAPNQPALTALQTTLISAKRGDRSVLPQLAKVLTEHPEIWRDHGDLTVHDRTGMD